MDEKKESEQQQLAEKQSKYISLEKSSILTYCPSLDGAQPMRKSSSHLLCIIYQKISH